VAWKWASIYASSADRGETPVKRFSIVAALLLVVVSSAARAQVLDRRSIYEMGPITAESGRQLSVGLPHFHAGVKSKETTALLEEIYETFYQDLRMARAFKLVNLVDYSGEINSGYVKGTGGPNLEGWYLAGLETLVTGEVRLEGRDLALNCHLYDTKQKQYIVGKSYTGRVNDVRSMVHRFADEMVFRFTGEKGIASSRVALVLRTGEAKEIYIADYDGNNMRQLTGNGSLNLSPDVSPDGNQVAYVSYRDGTSDVYVANISARTTRKVVNLKGTNAAPAWSPDGRWLAFANSNDGNTDIYLVAPDGSGLKRLTSSSGIDTSPTWSPSGREMAFVSDRSGDPQIFVMDAEGTNQRRLTTSGNYNVAPDWSPKGDKIAFVRRVGGTFELHVMSADGSSVQQLTWNQGDNEDPSWSPDGQYILFGSNRFGHQELFIISANRDFELKLFRENRDFSNPNWGT
jgi:TolB protein